MELVAGVKTDPKYQQDIISNLLRPGSVCGITANTSKSRRRD
jgi:cellulase/cellobiase CelA1